MGRWGWRQIATLVVAVWVVAACGSMLPALPLEESPAPEATLELRTVSQSPPTTPRTPGAATLTASQPPRATQTPSPIATPYYYTVESGDTLNTIAEQFNITVAELQKANGGLPANRVIPGQLLLIPVMATVAASSTLIRFLTTNPPLPLELSSPTCYQTPANEALCLGWVPNTLADPVTGVMVQVSLQNADGESLVQHTVSIPQPALLPDQGAPYVVRFTDPPAFASASVKLLRADQAAPDGLDTAPLTLLESQRVIEDGLVRISGVFQNEGEIPLVDVLIIATLFDDEGRVTGFRIQRPEGEILPGETLDVDLLIMPLESDIADHWLYAEGRLAPPEP